MKRNKQLRLMLTAITVVAMLAAAAANGVDKTPREEKRNPKQEGTIGAPPCSPKQDYSGNYKCTDRNGVVWDCKRVDKGWSCTKAPIQPKP